MREDLSSNDEISKKKPVTDRFKVINEDPLLTLAEKNCALRKQATKADLIVLRPTADRSPSIDFNILAIRILTVRSGMLPCHIKLVRLLNDSGSSESIAQLVVSRQHREWTRF